MNLSSNVNLFLGLHANLKVFHWQTKGFSRHEGFASVRSTIEDLMDDFVEQAMGQYGRFILDEESKNINLINLSEAKPSQMAETICEALVQLTDQIDPKDTNLLNIRDEMLGAMQKLKYLLTLE